MYVNEYLLYCTVPKKRVHTLTNFEIFFLEEIQDNRIETNRKKQKPIEKIEPNRKEIENSKLKRDIKVQTNTNFLSNKLTNFQPTNFFYLPIKLSNISNQDVCSVHTFI